MTLAFIMRLALANGTLSARVMEGDLISICTLEFFLLEHSLWKVATVLKSDLGQTTEGREATWRHSLKDECALDNLGPVGSQMDAATLLQPTYTIMRNYKSLFLAITFWGGLLHSSR